MSECEHTPHNWNLVYQCRGCGEIVHEDMAQKYDAANAREHAALKREVLLLNAQLIHAKAHDCMASTAGEWGEAYTWDSLSEEMRNHWIQQALLTEDHDDQT